MFRRIIERFSSDYIIYKVGGIRNQSNDLEIPLAQANDLVNTYRIVPLPTDFTQCLLVIHRHY